MRVQRETAQELQRARKELAARGALRRITPGVPQRKKSPGRRSPKRGKSWGPSSREPREGSTEGVVATLDGEFDKVRAKLQGMKRGPGAIAAKKV